MKTGYKVVKRLRNGDKVSCLAQKQTGLRATYITHGKAQKIPQGMIFDNLEHARDFRGGFDPSAPYEVWECDFDSCKHINLVFDIWDINGVVKNGKQANFIRNAIASVACSITLGRYRIYSKNAPVGTYLATNITLTRKVD